MRSSETARAGRRSAGRSSAVRFGSSPATTSASFSCAARITAGAARAMSAASSTSARRSATPWARTGATSSGVSGGLRLAGLDDWETIIETIAEGWRDALGLEVTTPTWTPDRAWKLARPWEELVAPIVVTGWLPGYADPEYYLRLLLHSESKTNEGGFAYEPFDELIERARQERSDRSRLELFHEADRMAVADRIALIPIAYGRSMSVV